MGWVLMDFFWIDIMGEEIRLLTLNMFLRPPGIKNNFSDFKDLRTNLLIEDYLGSFDIICLQEVFETLSSRKEKIMKQAERMGFYAVTTSKPSITKGHLIDSGLLILSRYEILEQDEVTYTEGKGVDRLCSKGGLYIKIKPFNTPIHIFTTHLQAEYFTENFKTFLQYRQVKKSQLIEFKNFVNKKTQFSNDPIFLAGDFNVDGRENNEKFKLKSRPGWENMAIEYEEFMNIIGKNEFFDVIRRIYNESLATFAVVDKTGRPLETVLTSASECTQDECLDYVLIKNEEVFYI